MKLVTSALLFVSFSLGYAQYETEADEETPYNVIREIPVTSGSGDWTIEERFYPATKWVCHEVEASPRSQRNNFGALFRYITGSNVDATNIPMTAPVTMEKASSYGERMCFWINAAHQAAPPAPTDSNTYIQNRPDMTVYTRRFGGYAKRESTWAAEAEQLKAGLQQVGEDNAVDLTTFYRAGYDSPFQFIDRRNEVWYVKN